MNIKFKCLVLSSCVLALYFGNFGSQSTFANSESAEKDTICWWGFDDDGEETALEKVGQKKDSVFGNVEYVPGVYGKAIKLDGFGAYIKKGQNTVKPEGAFTVESWVALASYPWSWSPVADCSYPKIKGFFFGIDREGHVGFKTAAGRSWYEVMTTKNIPLRKWTHIAAVFEPGKKITVFINGKEAASAEIKGNYVPSRRGSLTIGRNNTSQTWKEFQLTTEDTHFFLDGLLDEIRITAKAKTEKQISKEYKAIKKIPTPALSDRTQLPIGPVGSGSFGAFYSKLDYYKEWDQQWRVSDLPDVFVRFDKSPVQLVFWRGASFVPCWVTENGIWYTNEWLETWGGDVVSCAEPIMDRKCRYSHVRIIENTDARVVVHWRYALSDAFYDIAGLEQDGRGEWCDEYHIIYPDQVGVRRMELHYCKPERKHDWVEQIVVLPPGKYPEDVMQKDAISLVNMAGDVKGYSWHDKDLQVQMPEPKGANMSVANTRSKYRPFIIVPPGPVKTVEGTWDSPFFRTYASKMARGYRQDPVPSVYGWWDHWPVAQVPGDGRWVSVPDRPSHFNLTTFVQWNDLEKTKKTRTRIMLQGVTDKKDDKLVPLAKSWLQAAKMKIISDAYKGGTYDQSEKAYLVEKTDLRSSAAFTFVLEASKESPLLNPAFIIKNWNSELPALSINGKKVKQGKDFRQGIRKGSFGEDLIVWIRLETQKPVKIELGPSSR